MQQPRSRVNVTTVYMVSISYMCADDNLIHHTSSKQLRLVHVSFHCKIMLPCTESALWKSCARSSAGGSNLFWYRCMITACTLYPALWCRNKLECCSRIN